MSYPGWNMTHEESDWKAHKLLVMDKLDTLSESVKELTKLLADHCVREELVFKEMRDSAYNDKLKLTEIMTTLASKVNQNDKDVGALAVKVQCQQEYVDQKFKKFYGVVLGCLGTIFTAIAGAIIKKFI